MFSTMTDRFFHGMNRKNTKFIDPAGIKTNLITSRSRRDSKSKSKSNKLFQNSKQLTSRNSFNQTLKTPSSVDNLTAKSTDFAPPLPFKQPLQRSRADHLSRTSTQFAPPIAAKDLHTLLEKHINNQSTTSRNEKANDESESKSKVTQTQNYLGARKSFKRKFRQKIQQNALRRYTNANYMQTKNNTDRVQQQDMKKLLNLMKKGKQSDYLQGPKSSFSNTILQNDLSKIISKNQNIQKHFAKKDDKNNNGFYEGVEFQHKKTTQVKSIQQNNRQVKPKKILSIATTIKQQPISKPSPQKSKIYPTNTEQFLHNNKIQMSDRIYKQSNKNTSPISFEKQIKKQGKQLNLRIDLSKIVDNNKKQQTDKLPGNQQQIKKINRKGIQNNVLSKSIQIPEIPEERNLARPPQPIIEIKKQPNKQIKEVKKIKKYATQERQQVKPKQNKGVIVQQFDQIQQIQLQQTKSKYNINVKKTNTEPNNVQKKTNPPKTDNQQKKKIQTSNKIIQENRKDNKTIQTKKTEQKGIKRQAKITKIQQKQLDLKQIPEIFQYYLNLIDQVGTFCLETKEFYEENQIQIFKEYKVTCFYLWYHLYCLRQRCLDAIQKKDTDWYQIPKKAFNHQKLINFFKQQASKVSKQEKKCQKFLKTYHESAKPYLEQGQRVLQLSASVNIYDKCLKILHQQFKQMEKAYRKAISSEDPKEDLYCERLCYIIEMFCQIKCLNGQELKELEQIQSIESFDRHYQNYKHLIAL